MTAYDKIYEVAADNYGIITAGDAKSLGVSQKALFQLVARGKLERRGYGVYRLASHHLPSEYDQYAEAVALVGEGAYVSGESVLALLDLALVNPEKISVTTAKRNRRTLPAWLAVVKASEDAEVRYYKGIPCESLPAAFRFCRGRVPIERLVDGIEKAERNGDFRLGEADILRKEFSND